MTGKKLSTLPFKLTSWKKWKKSHPGTLVMSSDTGHKRDYSKDPYEDYYKSPFSFFDSSPPPILPEKTLIFGIEFEGIKRAYPVEELKRLKVPFKDQLGGVELSININELNAEIKATGEDGRKIEGLITYWFVWHKFHPEGTVYRH